MCAGEWPDLHTEFLALDLCALLPVQRTISRRAWVNTLSDNDKPRVRTALEVAQRLGWIKVNGNTISEGPSPLDYY
jgi:hypothetical protein